MELELYTEQLIVLTDGSVFVIPRVYVVRL